MRSRRVPSVLVAVALLLAACTDGADRHRASPPTTAPRKTSPLRDRPLAAPVTVRETPDGVTLADPAFEPLPGARADFGRLHGAVYQIEMPEHWKQEAALDALVGWVERGRRPRGTNLDVDDLRTFDRTFELQPRPGTAEADTVPGAGERVVVQGRARLDGKAFHARWIGAVVRHHGLVTACQVTLPTIEAGRYQITVLGKSESAGCGEPGAEILFWTYVGDKKLYTTGSVPWPRGRTAAADVDFDTSRPLGAAEELTELSGEVYRADGRHVGVGSLVEASVGDVVCGVASIRAAGSFVGYILSVVGPDSVPGCAFGARLTFRVDGTPASQTAVHDPAYPAHLELTVG